MVVHEVTTDETPEGETNPEQDEPTIIAVTATTLQALAADTPTDEIHYRQLLRRDGQVVLNPDGTAKTLAYVTARFVQDRLDDVVGPANWQNQYDDLTDGSVRCGIGIDIDGNWLWKWDVGVRSMVEPVKGAHSDAFKRAGVLWGIARDLYDERDEDATPEPAAAQPVAAPPAGATGVVGAAPIQQVVTGGGAPQGATAAAGTPWACPLHNSVKVVPSGVSMKTGQPKPYPAFYACDVPGCDQKSPRGMQVR